MPWPLVPAALAALALLATPGPAAAQAERSAPRPDPMNPRADVPPFVYSSALASYRFSGEVPVGSWREANDKVTRIGGWRAYTREANEPEAPDMRPGHGGHRGQPTK